MSDSRRPTLRFGAEILIASFVVLFQELALIRWLPGQIRVLAYFPNVVLISAFLGLGLGALRTGRRSLLWLWPVSLATLALVGAALGNVAFTQESESEYLWLLYFDLPPGSPVFHGIRVPIVGIFILSAVSFIGLGQFVSTRLNEFQRGNGSLWGYSWDLLGSLFGVIAFSVLSFSGTFPILWFSVFLGAGLILFLKSRRALVLYALAAAVTLGIVYSSEKASFYSPYYALNVQPHQTDAGFAVLTNRSLHQRAIPLNDPDSDGDIRIGYYFPYTQLRRPPGNVLIVGAGTGNDVSVALHHGAAHIDAVEIDPAILHLGRTHPDKPYESPLVRTVNNDARAWLNQTDQHYDLIVFGTLDSMTRLSALSNVRLDNFVYTKESLEAARRRLSEGGGVVMYFMVATDYIDTRLRSILSDVFGEPPIVVARDFGMFNRIYLAGPAFRHLTSGRPQPRAAELAAHRAMVEIPTDDWPYLYLEGRSISPFYLSLILIFGVLSLGGIFALSPEMRRALRGGFGGFDAEMFLFGAAFLLLETKLVTEMNLVWGATWLTSAVVFGSILFMILLGTLLMQLRPIPWRLCVAGLILTLLASYAIPTGLLANLDAASRLGLSVLFVGLPILFASACFALIFRTRPQPGIAFGWNLIGAVCGGLLEFSSMATGLKSLTLVALAFYLAAFLIRWRTSTSELRAVNP